MVSFDQGPADDGRIENAGLADQDQGAPPGMLKIAQGPASPISLLALLGSMGILSQNVGQLNIEQSARIEGLVQPGHEVLVVFGRTIHRTPCQATGPVETPRS